MYITRRSKPKLKPVHRQQYWRTEAENKAGWASAATGRGRAACHQVRGGNEVLKLRGALWTATRNIRCQWAARTDWWVGDELSSSCLPDTQSTLHKHTQNASMSSKPAPRLCTALSCRSRSHPKRSFERDTLKFSAFRLFLKTFYLKTHTQKERTGVLTRALTRQI